MGCLMERETLKAKNGNYYEEEFKEGFYDGYGKFIWETAQEENKEKYIEFYKFGKKG